MHFKQELKILEESRKDYALYAPLRREEGAAEGRQSSTKASGRSRGGILPMQVFYSCEAFHGVFGIPALLRGVLSELTFKVPGASLFPLATQHFLV